MSPRRRIGRRCMYSAWFSRSLERLYAWTTTRHSRTRWRTKNSRSRSRTIHKGDRRVRAFFVRPWTLVSNRHRDEHLRNEHEPGHRAELFRAPPPLVESVGTWWREAADTVVPSRPPKRLAFGTEVRKPTNVRRTQRGLANAQRDREEAKGVFRRTAHSLSTSGTTTRSSSLLATASRSPRRVTPCTRTEATVCSPLWETSARESPGFSEIETVRPMGRR